MLDDMDYTSDLILVAILALTMLFLFAAQLRSSIGYDSHRCLCALFAAEQLVYIWGTRPCLQDLSTRAAWHIGRLKSTKRCSIQYCEDASDKEIEVGEIQRRVRDTKSKLKCAADLKPLLAVAPVPSIRAGG